MHQSFATASRNGCTVILDTLFQIFTPQRVRSWNDIHHFKEMSGFYDEFPFNDSFLGGFCYAVHGSYHDQSFGMAACIISFLLLRSSLTAAIAGTELLLFIVFMASEFSSCFAAPFAL